MATGWPAASSPARKQAGQERTRNLRLLEQSKEVAGLGSRDYHVATGALHCSDGRCHLFGLPLGTPATPHCCPDVVLAEAYSPDAGAPAKAALA